jgi:hypothetical protein
MNQALYAHMNNKRKMEKKIAMHASCKIILDTTRSMGICEKYCAQDVNSASIVTVPHHRKI